MAINMWELRGSGKGIQGYWQMILLGQG